MFIKNSCFTNQNSEGFWKIKNVSYYASKLTKPLNKEISNFTETQPRFIFREGFEL